MVLFKLLIKEYMSGMIIINIFQIVDDSSIGAIPKLTIIIGL
jgi:hypothetical protein